MYESNPSLESHGMKRARKKKRSGREIHSAMRQHSDQLSMKTKWKTDWKKRKMAICLKHCRSYASSSLFTSYCTYIYIDIEHCKTQRLVCREATRRIIDRTLHRAQSIENGVDYEESFNSSIEWIMKSLHICKFEWLCVWFRQYIMWQKPPLNGKKKTTSPIVHIKRKKNIIKHTYTPTHNISVQLSIQSSWLFQTDSKLDRVESHIFFNVII